MSDPDQVPKHVTSEEESNTTEVPIKSQSEAESGSKPSENVCKGSNVTSTKDSMSEAETLGPQDKVMNEAVKHEEAKEKQEKVGGEARDEGEQKGEQVEEEEKVEGEKKDETVGDEEEAKDRGIRDDSVKVDEEVKDDKSLGEETKATKKPADNKDEEKAGDEIKDETAKADSEIKDKKAKVNVGDEAIPDIILSPRPDNEEAPEPPAEPEDDVKFDQAMLKKKRIERPANELLELVQKRVQQENNIWDMYYEMLGVDKRQYSCLVDTSRHIIQSGRVEKGEEGEKEEKKDEEAYKTTESASTETTETTTTTPSSETTATTTTTSTTTTITITTTSSDLPLAPIPSVGNTKKAKMIEAAKNYVLRMAQVRSYKETDIHGMSKKDKIEMFQEELEIYTQLQAYAETNLQKVLEGQQKVEEMTAELKKLEQDEQKERERCLEMEKETEDIQKKALMFFLVSQNISVDVLKSTADAKKLEKRIDERLETAYELLLLHQPLYELHAINQTEMTEYHKLMDQNIQRRQKASIPLDEPIRDLPLPPDLAYLLDLHDEPALPIRKSPQTPTQITIQTQPLPIITTSSAPTKSTRSSISESLEPTNTPRNPKTSKAPKTPLTPKPKALDIESTPETSTEIGADDTDSKNIETTTM